MLMNSAKTVRNELWKIRDLCKYDLLLTNAESNQSYRNINGRREKMELSMTRRGLTLYIISRVVGSDVS